MNVRRFKKRSAFGSGRELFWDMATDNLPIDLEMLDTTFGKDGRVDILSTFITHTGVLFARVDKAFDENEIEAIIDVAHQIKGMCASIYAPELSGKALNLERLAKSNQPDWAQMTDALSILKSDFHTLSTYLSTQI